jgi:putative ABC transport system permease protein
MRALTRKLLRDVWRIRWRALGVALTVACGTGVFAGIEMAIASLFNTRDVLLERMRFADLEVQFLPEEVANLPDLSGIAGVRSVERRLILPGTVVLDDTRRIVATLVFLESPSPGIDALELVSGRPLTPGDPESAVIERSLALYHDFRVGDRIQVRVGDKVYASRIDGVAVSPEYLATAANADYVVPEKGALGVVFTGLGRISDAIGFTMVNDLLFRFEPGADHRVVTEAILEALGRLNLERVQEREEHFIWKYLQVNLEAFEIYTPSIVVILAVLAFVLTLMTVNRLVLDQRREIGLLQALGYVRARVLGVYLGAGVLLGAVGGVIGIGLAFAFRNLFAAIYADAIGLPTVLYVVAPSRLAAGLVAGAAITGAAAALPVLRVLRLPPQAVIRGTEDERAARGWLPSILARTQILPMPVRFGVRNMFRQPGRTLATAVAIAASLGVSVAYVVAMTSTYETIEMAFERERWDVAVDFLYPVFLDDLEPIRSRPEVTKVEPYIRRFAEVRAGGHDERASILGIDPTSGMKRTLVKTGRFLSGRPDELLLSQDLARRLRIGVGDRVSVRIRRGAEFPFRVVGISGEIVLGQIVMPFSQAQAIAGLHAEGTGAYIEATGAGTDLVAAITGLESVGKVTTKGGLMTAYRRLMSEMMGIVHLATGVSVFVAMLFIVTSINLAIAERRSEYATLKSLGYGPSRLQAIILTEALGQAGGAAVLSVPIGIGLAAFLNARMSQAWYEVMTIVRAGDVAGMLLAAVALALASASPGLRTVARLDLARVLRTRTIE